MRGDFFESGTQHHHRWGQAGGIAPTFTRWCRGFASRSVVAETAINPYLMEVITKEATLKIRRKSWLYWKR